MQWFDSSLAALLLRPRLVMTFNLRTSVLNPSCFILLLVVNSISSNNCNVDARSIA